MQPNCPIGVDIGQHHTPGRKDHQREVKVVWQHSREACCPQQGSLGPGIEDLRLKISPTERNGYIREMENIWEMETYLKMEPIRKWKILYGE